jgi:hypothetical protein
VNDTDVLLLARRNEGLQEVLKGVLGAKAGKK